MCELPGQINWFDSLDLQSGRTSPELSAPTAAKTSRPFSRSSSGSQSRTPQMCLCLQKASGQSSDCSTMSWVDGVLLTEYTIASFGESPSVAVESRLSWILEDSPPERYSLSDKACLGILRRAEKRGKELPKELKLALESQAARSGLQQTRQSHLKETGRENPTGAAE